MPRKARSDSKLEALPDNQRDMLIRWFVDENISYDAARDRLLEDFNVATSNDALSRFWQKHCFRQAATQAKTLAAGVKDILVGSGGEFNAATLSLIEKRAFEIAYAKNGNIDELQTLARIIGDSQKLQIKRDQLDHSREKFFEQMKTGVEKGLDALYAELKGNAPALALFDRLKATVMQSMEGAS